MEGGILGNALVFLGISLLTVPISKRLGIGSVLGYLIGGVLIGPYLLGFIGHEGEDIMHAAEFGVVMMLFVIGLELNPASFWKMRKSIVGMGLSQMLASTGLLWVLLLLAFPLHWTAALALALSLAMSSTAIVLQILKEKNLGKTEAGISSFSILLFQDIAVIPILAIIPLLATAPLVSNAADGHTNWVEQLDAPFSTLVILSAVAGILLAGKFLITPMLRWLAKAYMRELFTAATLFIVIGVAWLMEKVGISAALGTFIAGLMLANSEFRHELETDIEPFKGVLLGLFFTAVGSTINFELIAVSALPLFSFVFGLMLIKGAVLHTIARVFKLRLNQQLFLALLLSQVGEFAFVLLTTIGQYRLLDQGQIDFFMAAVTISMVVSPILLFLFERFVSSRLNDNSAGEAKAFDAIDEHHTVVMAGFGHFGNTLGRFLRANGVSATILDNDSDRVAFLRKMGFKVFYGDATRLDLLHTAGLHEAKVFISTLDDPEKNRELAETVRTHFPHVRIFMRSRNRSDAYELIDLEVPHIYRESLHTSVQMGVDVLEKLGFRKYTATRKAAEFIRYDEAALSKLASKRSESSSSYINSVREEIAMQERLLQEDDLFLSDSNDHAWDRS